MTKTIITGASVWNGTSETADAATVTIDGNKIMSVDKSGSAPAETDAVVIDGSGHTLIPGLVEGHCHPSFTNVNDPWELGQLSPEDHMLKTAANLRLLLSHGFTSIFEAASAKPLLGVVTRDAIASGLLDGPRMRAASPEVTTTAG